jgi:aminoglycoside phosphotransferase (APT) family kinase protein
MILSTATWGRTICLWLGDRVSGIVDWDAAGSGDRSLDLSKLLFYAYDDSAIRADVCARIITISGRAALDILLAYNILAQLDGQSIIIQLQRLTQASSWPIGFFRTWQPHNVNTLNHACQIE